MVIVFAFKLIDLFDKVCVLSAKTIVPVASGREILLSAVGSTVVSVVSNSFGVAPSKIT